jgi:tetratricopeptide (TPR) repeat protein
VAATKATNNPAPHTEVGISTNWPSATSTNNATADSSPAPSTPREYFNAGTKQLAAHKYREAEAFLESSLASQQDSLEFPALYNRGQVRFYQGVEELKKNPNPKPALDRAKATEAAADNAIKAADAALASDDVQKMVAAYMHGRGVRKDLKSATSAVQDALATYRTVLGRWERSSGDFKGAAEVKQSDADALHNAEVVDRSIAKLVDSLRKMQQCNNGMCDKGKELGDKLQKLKGKIPAPNMPPGAEGEEDEDEEYPFGPKPGQKEGPTKEGQQIALTPEQAGWLLDGFKLDSERRLPMGAKESGQPKDRSRATW